VDLSNVKGKPCPTHPQGGVAQGKSRRMEKVGKSTRSAKKRETRELAKGTQYIWQLAVRAPGGMQTRAGVVGGKRQTSVIQKRTCGFSVT